MEDSNLISVIIPIYNVERFLKRCLLSIVNQTYNKLQIVLIDDGSTDESFSIADSFKKIDKRIILIKQNNKGLAGALNTGLKYCTGDYIGFVDSDDFLSLDFYENLINDIIQNNADITGCNYMIAQPCLIESPKDYWHLFEYNTTWCVSRCNKLYKSALFKDYIFPEGRVGEDLFHALDIFSKHYRIFISNRFDYSYAYNQGSISHNHKPSDWVDIIDGWAKVISLFKTLYGNSREIIYPTINCIKYYYRLKKMYPNEKKIIHYCKKIIKKEIILKPFKKRKLLIVLIFLIN